MRNYILLIYMLLFQVINVVVAQKMPLDQKAYSRWNHMDSPSISATGKWITYWVRSVVSNPRDSAYSSPYVCVCNTENGNRFEIRNATNVVVSQDENWLFYKTTPQFADTVSRDSCVFLNLESGKKKYWNRDYACDLTMGGKYIFYEHLLERKQYRQIRTGVFLDLDGRDSLRIDSLDKITYLKDKESIFYSKWENDSLCSLWYGKIKGKFRRLDNKVKGSYVYHMLSVDEKSLLLFMASDAHHLDRPDLVYNLDLESGKKRLVLDWQKVVMPEGYKLSSTAVFLGAEPKYVYAELMPEKENLPENQEKQFQNPDFELWSWNDATIPSMQDPYGQNYNPKYVYNISNRKWICLSNSPMDLIDKSSGEERDYALKMDYSPYYRNSNWTERVYFDLYLISYADGKETLVSKGLLERPAWSPDKKYVLFYQQDEQMWYVLTCQTGETRAVSCDIPYPVYRENYDYPQAPPAYGFMAWTKDRNSVILCDKYDLWKIDLAGKQKPYCITDGYGREHRKELRMALWGESALKHNFRSNEVDLKNNLLLTSVDELTCAGGFYDLREGKKPVRLLEGDFSYHFYGYSPDGKKCIWNRMSYQKYPELWCGESDLSNAQKVGEINVQQNEYNWGSVKMVHWNTLSGKFNRGLLYLPENYDPAKTYPVVVFFYENSTNKINEYKMPEYSNSIINIPTYVSRGYVVFTPDIQYKIGHPYDDCYDAVISGVSMLIRDGIADKERIGLQGHSWAGSQAVNLVTRTNLFRCAQIGAGVVNAVSGYTGMRGNGSPRMYMYELTQSRLGKTLWEGTDLYLESSPILQADQITTPLLILHNNRDEAVPYSQGLDLYFAMRRLQKPAWLLNYKNEGHVLRGVAAMQDWTIRMQQFFDYHLMGTQKPRWMEEGISVQEGKTDLKYDFAD